MRSSLEMLLTQYCKDISNIRHLLKKGEHSRAILKLTVLESSLHTTLATLNTDQEDSGRHNGKSEAG